MRFVTVLATCGLGLAPLLATVSASAQPPAAGQDGQAAVRMALRIAHNQLGVLQHCQANGSVGADVVELQRRLLARMTAALPPVQGEGLDQAEAAGKRGVVQFGAQDTTLAEAAKLRNTTPDAVCRQIATLIQGQADQLPK